MMIEASHKTRIIGAAALLVADALFFTTTNAGSVVSVALIIGFGLSVVTLYLLFSQLLIFSSLYGLPFRRRHRQIALLITGVVAAILALVTVGEFTTRDILVMTPMILVAVGYLTYGRGRSPTAS